MCGGIVFQMRIAQGLNHSHTENSRNFIISCLCTDYETLLSHLSKPHELYNLGTNYLTRDVLFLNFIRMILKNKYFEDKKFQHL